MKIPSIHCIIFTIAILFFANPCLAYDSQKEKEIIDILSRLRESTIPDDLIETVHEDKDIFKATSLYLQMIDKKGMTEDEMVNNFRNLFSKAGWREWVPWIEIKRLKNSLYLVSIGYAVTTQPSSLYLFYDSSYIKIATGENGLIRVIDFRFSDNELGVIFNQLPGSTAFSPNFALLNKKEGKWGVCWTPEGQKEWIAIDGEIKFLTSDLSIIRVRGSSFALRQPEPDVDEFFQESHSGPHRFFIGTWEKRGCSYVRKTNLPLEATFYDRLWEMTDLSDSIQAPYAIVYEFLRRLRKAEYSKAEELSSKYVIETAKTFGLSDIIDKNGNLILYSWEDSYYLGIPSSVKIKAYISKELFSVGNGDIKYLATEASYSVIIRKDESRWVIEEIEREHSIKK